MVKMKVKKEMTFNEYAKHLIDKFGVKNIENQNEIGMDSDALNETSIHLSPFYRYENNMSYFISSDKVLVNFEEEITENTKIPKMIKLVQDSDGKLYTRFYENMTIKFLNITDQKTIAYYMMNDDYTTTLIWKDGELVE